MEKRNFVKDRLIPNLGWLTCSLLFTFAGWLTGAGIGYLCLDMGLQFPEGMYSGMGFLLFPFYGGIAGLVVMHVIRIIRWKKILEGYRGNGFLLIAMEEICWAAAYGLVWAVFVHVL